LIANHFRYGHLGYSKTLPTSGSGLKSRAGFKAFHPTEKGSKPAPPEPPNLVAERSICYARPLL
jgi:hypothetical protein